MDNGVNLFQVQQFCGRRQLRLYQGDHLLHSQTFAHLGTNRSYRLSSAWLATVDLQGEPLRLTLTA